MNNTSNNNFHCSKGNVAAVSMILLMLLFAPAPLLPQHHLAEAIQSLLGINWKIAYLAAAVGLQSAFYIGIGVLSAMAVTRSPTASGRLRQIIVVPLVVIAAATVIRSVKMGHPPVWSNTAIPIAACLAGVWLGLGLLYQRRKTALAMVATLIGVTLFLLLGRVTTEMTRATEAHLRRLVAAGATLPSDKARFGTLVQSAFAPITGADTQTSAVQHNRAAILALGISIGDERLARFVGLNSNSTLVRTGALLRQGTTLRGRDDWSRHFCLSAALAVLEHPLISDACGLMKEQMVALSGGSGFSFGDLAADRAGVRFAVAATYSEAAAKEMQDLLQKGVAENHFFPPAADLPENLTTEQFRREYGSVGSQRYRQKVVEIEKRLNQCYALSTPHSRPE